MSKDAPDASDGRGSVGEASAGEAVVEGLPQGISADPGSADAGSGPPLTVTLLGTGTSTGVPVIGCRCRVCTSDDARDRRTRTSAHVVAHTASGDVHLQIDVGPDFRAQALANGVEHVDALLVTHEHFDHVVGIDDLRPMFFRDRSPIPVFASETTASTLREMFRYIFERTYPGASVLDLEPIGGSPTLPLPAAFVARSRRTPAAAVRVVPMRAPHGRFEVLGFRIGKFGYLTDAGAVPEAARAALRGVDVLVLDGLRREPHPTHLTFDQAAEVARDIGAGQTWLTHVTHDLPHAEADARLPETVRLGYDGLVLRVN